MFLAYTELLATKKISATSAYDATPREESLQEAGTLTSACARLRCV